ncbi:permease prefix domain 1-containing protein [Microbacterium sp. 3J1]|uniref:permease prefix domain 1-containing protein n=1 Tax=Microbacterium sp. 3J1 TaxID=861269 RepID=UPI000A948173|nr:permease prefix domain 1-containing protein [Microbacterium sp. 3J1]
MTTTVALTERYISATIRSLRPETQDDVRAELEASIADAIDARVDQGESPEDAERRVLTDLGDPGILAAGYADRPLHLIGPKYYLVWWRLLKLLLIIVPVCAMGGVAVAQAIDRAPIGSIIGAAVAVGISVIVHVCFWVTLVFFILERTGADTGVKWDVDQLPEPTQNGAGRADAIASLVFLILGVGAIFWDAFIGFFPTDGAPIAVLNPGLWPWGITFFIGLIVAEALLAVAVYARRRWTVGAAIVNTVLAVIFAIWSLTLLLQGQLLNPEFLSHVFTDTGVTEETMRILTVITAFGLIAFPIWDIVDGWIKTARARRG